MNRFAPFEWIAATRFLREGSSQTLLTIVGAAIGVAVIVFMSSLLTGVQANIFRRILSTQAHVVISAPKDIARPLRRVAPDDVAGGGNRVLELATIQNPAQRLRSIDQWQLIAARIALRPDVVAVSPTVSGSAFVVRGDAAKAVSLIGVVPAEYFKIVAVPEKIIQGSALLIPGNCLIGKELAINLGVGLGEKLRVRTGAAGGTDGDETLIIDGIFDMGDRGSNERSVFVALRTAQSIFDVPGGVTAISVNLADPYQAELVAAELMNEIAVTAESWIKTFDQLFTALSTQTIANRVIQFFVALAVALGIASVLVVSVVQRRREIGILRAMGTSRKQVLLVFLLQGAIIGLAGSVLGSATGAGFVQLWRTFARNADGTEFFPLALPLSLFVVTGIVATLTGLVTAVLPAVSAARLDPVDAIRG